MADFMEITDSDYNSFIAQNNGILLFYKKLCPHCKAIEKVMDRLAGKGTTAVMARINSEENEAAMGQLEVERVPTLLI